MCTEHVNFHKANSGVYGVNITQLKTWNNARLQRSPLTPRPHFIVPSSLQTQPCGLHGFKVPFSSRHEHHQQKISTALAKFVKTWNSVLSKCFKVSFHKEYLGSGLFFWPSERHNFFFKQLRMLNQVSISALCSLYLALQFQGGTVG